jgi:hypothetical protein
MFSFIGKMQIKLIIFFGYQPLIGENKMHFVFNQKLSFLIDMDFSLEMNILSLLILIVFFSDEAFE